MIQLTNVYKSYHEQPALQGVSLSVSEGQCAVLIGPSGCGKSTLLKTINRMVDIDKGQVTVQGKPVQEYAPEELRRSTGYCIQGVGLFPHLSVSENIAMVPRLLKWPEDKIVPRVNLLMELSGLPLSYLDKKPHQLSGGEAQRVGVCRALAADPPILLMDEPFGSVDPLNREKLQQAFIALQKELRKTVLFVTHDVEEALMVGDLIFVMNQGRVVAKGTPGQLAGSMESAFAREFLGKEYPMKLLKRYAAQDISMVSLENNGEEIQVPETEDVALSLKTSPLTEKSNLQQVLSRMLEENRTTLPVLREDDTVSYITYESLVAHFKEISQ
ncbi:MAG: ABC transporter ATP-binding protein [Bacteroidia bacterium]|nr:ABC transporter ATP-binding protein [Bacteroidia bacterium]